MRLNEPTIVRDQKHRPAAQPSASIYWKLSRPEPPLRSTSTSSVSSVHSGHGASQPAATATIVSSSAAPSTGTRRHSPRCRLTPASFGESRQRTLGIDVWKLPAPPPAYVSGGKAVHRPAYGGGSSVRVGAGWGGGNSVPVSSAPAYQAYNSSGGIGNDARQTSVDRQSDGGQYSSELSQLSGMGSRTDSSPNLVQNTMAIYKLLLRR